MSSVRYDKELELFRNQMLPPGTFDEGFRWSSLIGALFIAMLMGRQIFFQGQKILVTRPAVSRPGHVYRDSIKPRAE